MLSKFIVFLLVLYTVRSQKPSPCPDILFYEPRAADLDRWYAVISLGSREQLKGIWLRITLDRTADLLGNVFGDATTTDNKEFLIRSQNYILEAGTTTSVRFFVKYNAASIVPSVSEINLNGKTICSSIEETTQRVQTRPTTHRTRPNSRPNSDTTARPTSNTRPSNTNNRPSNNANPSRPNNVNTRPNTSSNRPTNTDSDYNVDTRPSNSGNGVNRPSNSNNRPINNDADIYTGSNRPSSTNNRPTSSSNGLNIDNQQNGGVVTRPSSNNFNSGSIFNGGVDNNYNGDDDDYIRPSNNGNSFGNNHNNNRNPDNNYNNQNNNFNQGGSNTGTDSNEDYFTGDLFLIANRPPSNPSTRPSVNINQQCGTVATQPRPLISYGQNTVPGQWPWHVALYHSKGIQLMYTCGGTLISKRHIVTAAHCVTKPHTNRPINPQNILAYLGKYNLKKFGSEIQDREISDIYVHPDYNHTVYYNDIAILRMANPAQITNYVRPVCLWDEPDDLNEIEGHEGTVVGWGFDENRQLSTTLMQAKMPIVSTVTCIYSNREFFSQFTSEKSFCAGFRNGTSVCNGDSGGGMVFPRRGTSGSNTVWQIRGLVSVGVALQGQGVCDPTQYIVFTDVAMHTDWIQQILVNNP